MPHARLLLAEAAQHDSGGTLVVDVIVIVCLILVGGLMSGLTLGLMSLDAIDLELLSRWLQVLKRSGTPKEKLYAARIQPVLRNPHWTLVTLLLCNAAALEALPIFLDKLVSPVLAIILSVTAVLTFGEIIPQAACKSYALIIGAYTAWLVRILRVAVGIISWPIAKVLDWVLGKEHSALFRRAQLKALVNMHSIDENFGGHLSPAEIGIIGGALDLTHKTAAQGMTPLEQVFALPTDAILNVETLRSILATGHSRVPVHAPGNKAHILGLLLVKELVLVDQYANIAVSTQKVRALPHLRADTAMYDLLKLFQSGRTHMVVLTRPPKESAAALAAAKAAEALRDGADPTELTGVGFLTKRELKEASVKGNSKAAAALQAEAAPDPATLTRVSRATHSSQASHQALVKDEAVKEEREPPPADLAVQIDPKTVSAAVAQAHRSASLSSRNYSVLDTAAATPEDTLGIITIEDVIEELIGQEIVDETDTHHDNLKQHRVAKSQLASGSPRMRALLQQYQTAATMEAGFSGSEQSGTSSSGGSMFGGSGAGQIPLPAAAGKPAVRRKVFKSHSAKHLDHPRPDPSKLLVEDSPMERQPSAQSTKL